MSLTRFIARRLFKDKTSAKNTARKMLGIGTWSIAIGLAIMIISLAIVTGYRGQIQEKVIGFGAHITINSMDPLGPVQSRPISIHQSFYPGLDTVPGVAHIQPYALKPGIIRVNEQVHGIQIKGADANYDWTFFQSNLVDGHVPVFLDSAKSNDILISRTIANKMKLSVGDMAHFFFVDKRVWPRQFKVAGIYQTGFGSFDESMVIGDLKHIQKLNGWESDKIEGFEVQLDDFEQLDELDRQLYNSIGMDLRTTKITDRYMEIFGWLEYLNYNVVLILIVAFLVATFNMITSLLILILDRTNMIGMFKAMGASNGMIQGIFIESATILIGRGLLFGNVIGLGLCLVQKHFSVIKLPQETYYIPEVPIDIVWWHVLGINLATFILSSLMMVIPSMVVAKFSPIRSLRYN